MKVSNMNKKILWACALTVGILGLVFALMHDYVEGKCISYGLYDAIIITIAAIITIASLILFNLEEYKPPISLGKRINIFAVLLICILIILATYAGSWYGELQTYELKEEEPIQIRESPFKEMYCKKVIIRNDDVGGKVGPALQWLSNLTVEKDFKTTYAVIPATLRNNPETINYLNNLDKEYFEMATHGYHHIHFGGLPYEEQYSEIENGTKIMEEKLHIKPYTFIPPYGSSDVNTTKVCRVLGYHSITDMSFPVSYVMNFKTKFGWESNWSTHPVSHHSYQDFKISFDNFYNSSDEFFVVLLHHGTFYDELGKLNETMTSQFERSIDHIKNKSVEFMTFEEAYEWYVDEDNIRFGKVNESVYFIDLANCQYNHTIKFNSSSNWSGNVIVTDISTGNQIGTYENIFEFDGIKGHCYNIANKLVV